jgi:predicted RND superfamily exporter protein
LEKIARFTFRRFRLIIAFVVILNLISLASFFRFELDTDFLNLFTEGNPRAEEYDRLNEKYDIGEALSILIEQEDSLLEKENLKAVYRLQERVKGLDGVLEAQSFIPDELSIDGYAVADVADFIVKHPDLMEDFIEDKYFLADQFLSDDRSKGSIVVLLESDAVAADVLASLQELVQSEEHLSLSLAGNEVIKDTLWNYLLRIIFILPPCAIVLVLLIFFLVLRSFRFTILSVVPAGISVLWIFGTIFWSGMELNLVTVISPIFVLVVGSAYGLHYISHFMDNIPRYSDREQLTVETMRMVGVPIFLAAITTMAGFASLTWTQVPPMRQMGIFVSLGVGYAGFLAIFFLPAVMSRIELPAKLPQASESRLTALVLAVSRHKILIVASFAGIFVLSAFYIPRLNVVSNQLMFFRESSSISQTFDRVERYFGGALYLTGEVVAEGGVSTLRDYNYAEDILDAEREMERLPGVKSAMSIFDIISGMNKMATGRNEYPENPRIIHRFLSQIDDEDLDTWVSEDGLRVMLRTEDLESLDVDRLESYVAAHPDIRMISGMPVLFEEMNRLVVRSQAQSLGLALILVFIMILLTIRRLRAAIIALIPIIITIVAIMGMLVMSGFHLNILTANMSAISVGVGVDYSIHLISGIYYFRKQGLGREESVEAALASVSRPVLTNAFGLAIGLSILFFSPLRIHMQVASVMWVAMMVSSLAALLLIPILYTGMRSGKRKSEKT